MPTGISRSLLAGLALAALFLLVPAGPTRFAGGTSFNPSFSVTVSEHAPQQATDVNYIFSLEAPDAMPAEIISFTPSDWDIASDADVPDGEIVGEIHANVVLGLIGTACNIALPVEFYLKEATTSRAELVDHYTGAQDWDFDGLPEAVTRYPSRLTSLFPGIPQHARYYASGVLAGIPTAAHIVVFSPGQLPGFPAEAFAEVLIIDLWDPAGGQPIANTDWCSPLWLNRTAFGISRDNPETIVAEGGSTLRVAGQEGPALFSQYLKTYGDSDNDGIETRLDTCPFNANTGSPRIETSGDLDEDGLDAACDPNDLVTGYDEDGDGYLNRQDNCPLVMNGEQHDNQADADGDDIGDACDQAPLAYDGHQHDALLNFDVPIGRALKQGDTSCDNAIGSVDSLFILRHVAGLPAAPECLETGGDVDCDASVTAIDALGVLRFVAGLPVHQHEPCPDIGAPL